MHKPTFYEKYVKRLFSIIFSTLGLVLMLPIFIVIGLLIKLETPGPILFKQNRIGKNGKVFKIYKFRSMVDQAEKMGTGIKILAENDSRITKVGRFLRKTGIDELPQLFNIFKGDMSFVGPRPPVVFHPYEGYENYPSWIKKRFNVRPGVTGLAQVEVRNSVPWSERFKYDVIYVKSISLKNDIKIMFKTLGVLNTSESLYLEGDE